MSVNSYTNTSVLMNSLRRFVQTAGATPTELEFWIQDAEDELNGLLGSAFPAPFTGGNVPPMIRHMARRLAEYGWLRGQIIQEDPSRSDWVENIRTQVMQKVTGLLEGSMVLLSGSGTMIEPQSKPSDTIWSSTADYVPTMGIVSHPALLQVDPDRLEYEDERREDNP